MWLGIFATRQLLISIWARGLGACVVADWFAISRSVLAVSVFGLAMRGRRICPAGRSFLMLTGFAPAFQTVPDWIARRALRVCLMERPHIVIDCAVLLRMTLAMFPQASNAATDFADHDGNPDGNGKENKSEALANVP